MDIERIKNTLIRNGVNNLKEFGSTEVNTENIFTDFVYREFFKSMLNDNKGHSKEIDDAIDELLLKLDTTPVS